MEFCPNCNNYIFLNFEKKDDKFEVYHNCKNCGTVINKTSTLNENSCMFNNPHNIDKLQYYVKHKEHLKHDATIPHIDVIPCPNKECPSASPDVRNDVLYINLDEQRLYMLYICAHCSSHWTNQ
jgi:DNA-directed RNA polymerase subunit M/transcription elongation factor TFIIS